MEQDIASKFGVSQSKVIWINFMCLEMKRDTFGDQRSDKNKHAKSDTKKYARSDTTKHAKTIERIISNN